MFEQAKRSFTQDKELNIAKCDGCSERCKLGYRKVAISNSVTRIYATIESAAIVNYIDENGDRRLGFAQYIANSYKMSKEDVYNGIAEFSKLDLADFGKQKHLSATIRLARHIAKCCDNYKTKER